MTNVPVTAEFVVKADVVARTVADEMILLDLETGIYFTLNPVGAVIWKSLEAGLGREAIIAAIVEQYDTDAPTASADFDEYIQALASEGLVGR